MGVGSLVRIMRQVLEVCDRASANENNAKEAVRALRREFKCVFVGSLHSSLR